MKNKDWKQTLARDVLALGSWVFYFLVIARALIKPYRPFADQLIIAAIILVVINLFIKNYEGYTSRALILVVFTSLFYKDNLFTSFAALIGLGLIASSYYTGNDKNKIIKGILIGLIATLIGYYLPNLF